MSNIVDRLEQIRLQINNVSSELTKLSFDVKNSTQLEMDSEDIYLSVDELINYTKLSKSVIYSLRKHKMIPYVKIKNHYMFIKKDIDLWIENCADRITYETVSERLNV